VGLLAVVKKDHRCRARWNRRVDKCVRPTSGRQNERAIAREEGFGGDTVNGHDPDVQTFEFDSNNSALGCIDKANS
jgi:hypothetical protein